MPYLFKHLAEPVPSIDTDPQHPGVDEEPDQIIERLIQAPGDRGAHRHVLTDSGPVQHHRHDCLQHHRGRRVMRRRQRLDPRPHLRVDAHLHPVTAVTGHRRADPIGRQRHHLRQIGQLLPPVPQLPGNHTVGIRLRPQPLLLPQRVIGILHGQRRPLRGLALSPRPIRLAHIPGHRSQ